MGKPSAKQEVTDYRMSLHYGVCHGPTDAILGIYVGEKTVWQGEATSQTTIAINLPELFGGTLKEGGCVGVAEYLPGLSSQVMPSHLAAKFGLTSATCPAFRGISTVFFHGGGFYSKKRGSGAGFLWSTNNPYLRSIWVKVKRRPKALSSGLQMIGSDANPAAMIYECLTNTEWGMGAPSGIINQDSFEYAARVLLSEGFGMSMMWNKQATIQSFISEIIDHIQATLFVNPRDGKLTLKLIREDYYPTLVNQMNLSGTFYAMTPDVPETFGSLTNRLFKGYVAAAKPSGANVYLSLVGWDTETPRPLLMEDGSQIPDDLLQTTGEAFFFEWKADSTWRLKTGLGESGLPALNPYNCKVTSFDRKAWGETVNEIVVTWTNPDNEQEETVSAQDLANITIQGEIVSDSRNYYGVRNADLAMKLAMRDLASATAPLATFEIEVDRSAWDFVPGGCVELTYPEEGIDGLVIRVLKIDYGKPGQPTIKVNAIEDIFSVPVASYTTPDDTLWVDPSSDPEPLEYVRVITAPAFFGSAALDAAQVNALSYPEVLSGILASQGNSDTVNYDLVQETVLSNGDEVAEVIGSKPILGHGTLSTAIPAEASSIVQFANLVGGTAPTVSGFVFIGGTTEQYQEIAMLQSVSVGGWTLKRGVLDTVPRAWPANTECWFVAQDTNFIDTAAIRSDGDVLRYKLLSRTSRGRLDPADADVVGVNLSARPYLPNRPANVKVNGTSFGILDLSASPPSSLSITWANRNRLLEDSQVLGWTDGTVAPEDGQTTTVTVRDTLGAVLAVHDGITGTSFTLPSTSFSAKAVIDITVTAKRGGLESLQGHTIRVKVRNSGWGENWDDGWGGGVSGAIPPIPYPPLGGGGDPSPSTPFPDLIDQYTTT